MHARILIPWRKSSYIIEYALFDEIITFEEYKKLYEDVPISEQKATVTADTKTDIQKQRENILRGKFGQPTMVYSNISSEARQILREVDDK